ncbi:MAG: hypothetical protein U5N58_00040 [Actinomycetota bacterium]|nr:hypothetical protein [Actinomycetota bacterium]
MMGNFKPEVDRFAKMGDEDSNPAIIDDLKKRNLLFSFENYTALLSFLLEV